MRVRGYEGTRVRGSGDEDPGTRGMHLPPGISQ